MGYKFSCVYPVYISLFEKINKMPTPVTLFCGKTHKEKESDTDCQDSFSFSKETDCFAIADGASQSFYPSIWAQMLVKQFCQEPEIGQENWKNWLLPIQEKWLAKVKEKVETAKNNATPVWITNYNRLNHRESATSTFIGLRFAKNQVLISYIGDSCLFIFKEKQFIQVFPTKCSTEFSDVPQYFASYPQDNKCKPRFKEISLCESKETNTYLYFILATDALSEYILKCLDQKQDIISCLLRINSQQQFETFVSESRNTKSDIKMKNDDVTLVTVKVLADIESPENLTNNQSSPGIPSKFRGRELLRYP